MSRPPPPVRDAGPAAMLDPPPAWDRVDESLDESFPASDPPAWVSPTTPIAGTSVPVRPTAPAVANPVRIRMDKLLKTTTREASFKGRANHKIAYRVWEAPSPPRAIMLIVPGFNSHSGYFEWTAGQLATLGFRSYGVDLRGRGKSDGERFYVEAFDDYVSDVEGLMAVAASENPDRPIFVLGHSAGGVVSCAFSLKHQDRLAGLVCESFAFQVPSPDFVLAVLKGISHLAPHAHVLALKNKDFSRDPAVVAAMDADPLIAHEVQPTRTVAEMVRADERLKIDFPKFRLPLLILHGTADAVTKHEGSQYFFDHAGSSDKTLKLYKGHVHDLLNDTGREQVMKDITDWLEKHVV